jgi:hypothetical protein
MQIKGGPSSIACNEVPFVVFSSSSSSIERHNSKDCCECFNAHTKKNANEKLINELFDFTMCDIS